MFIQILLVIAIFVVLIVLVLKGKLGGNGGIKSEAQGGVIDEQQARKYGSVEKTYLLGSNMQNIVTFEVYYDKGKSALEAVQIYTPRYDELKEKEAKRLSLNGGWGNAIKITYEDGRVVDCACSYVSFEAAQLREELAKQNSPVK